MYLIYDTETTNLPNDKISLLDPNQARICQLACLLLDEKFNQISSFCTLIKPSGWNMSEGAFKAHGITVKSCEDFGIEINEAMDKWSNLTSQAQFHIAHNDKFDRKLLSIEQCIRRQFLRYIEFPLKNPICTMEATTPICKLPHKRWPNGKSYKWPKLEEAIWHFFKEKLEGAHDAMNDVKATARLFKYLVENGHILLNPTTIPKNITEEPLAR